MDPLVQFRSASFSINSTLLDQTLVDQFYRPTVGPGLPVARRSPIVEQFKRSKSPTLTPIVPFYSFPLNPLYFFQNKNKP